MFYFLFCFQLADVLINKVDFVLIWFVLARFDSNGMGKCANYCLIVGFSLFCSTIVEGVAKYPYAIYYHSI